MGPSNIKIWPYKSGLYSNPSPSRVPVVKFPVFLREKGDMMGETLKYPDVDLELRSMLQSVS